eukprot:SAG11_NODE_628_length_8077_cov_4.820632_6_plen_123_part_00
MRFRSLWRVWAHPSGCIGVLRERGLCGRREYEGAGGWHGRSLGSCVEGADSRAFWTLSRPATLHAATSKHRVGRSYTALPVCSGAHLLARSHEEGYAAENGHFGAISHPTPAILLAQNIFLD